jgi:hypothetical protein
MSLNWWLVRYLSEGTPSLQDVARIVAFGAAQPGEMTTDP